MILLWQFPSGMWSASPVDGAVGRDVADVSLAELRHHFTRGHCWHLAIWLSAQTGLQAWSVMDSHAVVGDGHMFLDIDGWHTGFELLNVWESSVAFPARWSDGSPRLFVQSADDLCDWALGVDALPDEVMSVIAERVLAAYPMPMSVFA